MSRTPPMPPSAADAARSKQARRRLVPRGPPKPHTRPDIRTQARQAPTQPIINIINRERTPRQRTTTKHHDSRRGRARESKSAPSARSSHEPGVVSIRRRDEYASRCARDDCCGRCFGCRAGARPLGRARSGLGVVGVVSLSPGIHSDARAPPALSPPCSPIDPPSMPRPPPTSDYLFKVSSKR